MDLRIVADGFSVTGQLRPQDAADIAAAGFKTIICCRPDHEADGQPPHGQVRAAAEQAGLAFAYIPLAMGAAPDGQPGLMSAALAANPGPVLGYCRSGARAANIFALARAL
jgi:sulfide:quinone oxidoreductase